MNGIKNRVAKIAKQNSLLSTTLGFLYSEIFNRSLPFKYRVVRLLCRSVMLKKTITFFCINRKAKHFPTNDHSIFENLSVERIIQELNEKGFATGIKLPEKYVSQTLDFCSKTKARANGDQMILIDLADEVNPYPTNLIYSYAQPHRECETIDILAHDPFIVSVAQKYLNTEPVLSRPTVYWSYPYTDSKGEMSYTPEYGFHYDIDDCKFLKLFFYLNDVDENRGPHVIIEGTHKSKNLFEKTHRRMLDEQAVTRYGDRIKVITGKSGEGFFEDTFCYHKGTNPKYRRLILQLEYAINDFGKIS